MLVTKNYQLTPKREPTALLLRFLIIVVLVLGIFFRFVNLDRKVYWHDEAYTSLRVSGYTKAEFVPQVFNDRVINREVLQKYQRVNSEKGIIDTINSLATEDSQHPPLYYVIVRLWMQWFGNSVAVTRSLSVLISLLVFPGIYWLCIELFGSALVGWMAIALIAVSPLHILYAQEAREFVLWTVTILLSSVALLRAIRLETKLSWIIYAATLTLGFYTFPFTVLVAIAQGIYIAAIAGFRFTQTVFAYSLASITSIFTFLPWLLVILTHLSQVEQTTASAREKLSLLSLVQRWGYNVSNVFLNFWQTDEYFPNLHFPALRLGKYLIPLIIFLVIYSLYFLYCHTSKRSWLFVFALIGVTAIALIVPDLVMGGKLSTRTRYVIPCYLGIQLAVAYLLATKITSNKTSQRRFWQLVMAVVISGGVISSVISSQAETWWSKGSHHNPQIARIINKAAKPLSISSNYNLNIGDLMSLSHLLDPKVQLQLSVEPNIPKIPDGFSDIFLFNPSKAWQSQFEKEYRLQSVYKPGKLWRLEKKTDKLSRF